MLQPLHNGTVPNTGLPLHHWLSLKSQTDIEQYSLAHHLIHVEAEPQDAALTPSWPQVLACAGIYLFVLILVIYFLFWQDSLQTESRNPDLETSTDTEKKSARYLKLNLDLDPDTIFFLPTLIFSSIWWVAFVISELEGKSGGWVPVVVWYDWLALTKISPLFYVPLLSQWAATLAIIIQRWTGEVGSMAYRITDLHGCTPHEGLDYLQAGRYSQSFLIFQTVYFTLFTGFSLYFVLRKPYFPKEEELYYILAAIRFFGILVALYIYIAVKADQGMPMAVSGNCLLVEESPQFGFARSGIRSLWVVLSFFRGQA